MKYFTIIFLMILVSQQGVATIFKGTIGDEVVYLKMDCPTDKDSLSKKEYHSGSFFYASSFDFEYDIERKKGESSLDKYTFFVYLTSFVYDEIAVLKLTYRDGSFFGLYLQDKKQKEVILKPYREDESTLDEIKREIFSFKKEKIEKVDGNKSIVWIKERGSKIRFIRLGEGFSKTQREQINPFLKREHIRFIQSKCMFVCTFDFSIVFLSDDIIELRVDDDKYGYYLYYDLHKPKRYTEEDIFSFGENPDMRDVIKMIFKRNGWDSNSNKSRYCKEMAKDIGMERVAKGYFTKKGFVFRGLEDGLDRCDRELFLPYKVLKKYRNKNFPYKFE